MMATNQVSAFAGLKSAKISGKGAYLQPDKEYLLEIVKTEIISTRGKGDAFIATFKVLESNSDKDEVGCERSWYQSMVDRDIAFGAIKEFCWAVQGYDPSSEKEEAEKDLADGLEEVMNAAISDNALAGVKVYCSTIGKLTKAKGLPFTVHRWKPSEAKSK